MKIVIAAVGKMRQGPARKLADDYHGRLQRYRPLDLVDVRESTASLADERQRDEAEALSRAIPEGAVVVVLDERGKEWTSAELAAWLDSRMTGGARYIAFLVGGPEGHAQGTRDRADVVLALSRLTLPHDLARVVLAEQLYRAFTIVRGEPYHR